MTCEQFAQMLDNYESLADEEKALMEEHAKVCEACCRELDFMRSMINAVKTLPELKVPDDFLENLNKRIDAEEIPVKRMGIAGHIRYNWQKYSAVAACLVLVAVIGANYDILIDGMNGGDDGVINTVTTVTSPAPDNGGEEQATSAETDRETSGADNKAEVSNVQNVKTADSVTGDAPEFRNAGGSTVRQRGTETAAPQVTAQGDAAAKMPRVSETSKPTDGGIETMTLPRGVYVEARGARSIKPETADEAAQDNPYEINTMADNIGGYAVATIEEDECAGEGGLGYELNQSNMIIVNGEDFATALDIISRYVSDSYSNYFVVNAGKIDAMLAALDKAGVRYHSSIGFNADRITFRITIE